MVVLIYKEASNFRGVITLTLAETRFAGCSIGSYLWILIVSTFHQHSISLWNTLRSHERHIVLFVMSFVKIIRKIALMMHHRNFESIFLVLLDCLDITIIIAWLLYILRVSKMLSKQTFTNVHVVSCNCATSKISSLTVYDYTLAWESAFFFFNFYSCSF